MRRFHHVFFDLDGTLIDHFDAIHQSFVHAAQQLDLEPPSYEKVVATVGGSVPVTASRLFPKSNPETVSTLFESHFDTVMYDAVEINCGTEWLLQSLHEIGTQCVVFTNKRGDKARAICEHLGLSRWLSGIVGTGDTPWRKPEPEFTRHALRQFSAQVESSCLIGDSPFDEQAALCVGMPCFLVATGSHSFEHLCSEVESPVYPELHTIGHKVFDLPHHP